MALFLSLQRVFGASTPQGNAFYFLGGWNQLLRGARGTLGVPFPPVLPAPSQDLTEREGAKVGLVTGGRATLLPQHLLWADLSRTSRERGLLRAWAGGA